MVEEASSNRSLSEALQRVDDVLLDPDAAQRRSDKAAMAMLMAAGGMVDLTPRKKGAK